MSKDRTVFGRVRGWLAAACLLLLCVAGCGDPPKPLELAAKPSKVKPGKGGKLLATGGTPPYTYSLDEDQTGAKVSKSGKFVSGKNAGTDTYKVKDAEGAAATVKVKVRAAFSVSPKRKDVQPGERVEFEVRGGTPPYTFEFVTDGNRSGGELFPDDAGYTAGLKGGMDRIRISDKGGKNSVEVRITVKVDPLVLEPKQATLQPGGAQRFTATGGVMPYRWSLLENSTGGQITSHDGSYLAGPQPGVDRVQLTDAAGTQLEATVTVEPPPLKLTPGNLAVEPRQKVTYEATGGRAPYTFELAIDSSGSKVDPLTGRYWAGPKGGGDTIRVTDRDGRTFETQAIVEIAPLGLDPADAKIRAGGTLTVRVMGGVSPFEWTVDGPAGGRLLVARDGRTARYRAPANVGDAGGKVRVRVKDGAQPAQAFTSEFMLRPRPTDDAPDPELDGTPIARRRRSGPVAAVPVRHRLKNGMVCIVEENHTRPVAAITLAIKGGSAEDPAGKAGLFAVCSDLFGEGSESLAAGEIRDQLRAVGGDIYINNYPGEGWQDRAIIEIEVRPAHVPMALGLLARAFLRPKPDDAGVERVKSLLTTIVRQRDSSNGDVAWDGLQRLAFQGHPYERRWHGIADEVAALSVDDVRAHLARMASPERATLVVSGDVERKETLAKVIEVFGDAKRGAGVPERAAPPEAFGGERTDTKVLPSGPATIMAAFTVPGLLHPDRVSVELLAKVIEFEAQLEVLAIKRAGSLVQAGTDMFADLGIIWVKVVAPAENAWKAEEALINAFAKVKNNPVSDAVAAREKQRLRLSEIVQRERARYRGFRLSQAESAEGVRYALGMLQRIKNTTPNAITAAAQKYIRRDNLSIMRVVPESAPELSVDLDAQLSRARKVLESEKPMGFSFGKRLYSKDAAHTVIDDRGRLAEGWSDGGDELLDEVLPNGLRIVCREDRAVPLVNIGFYTAACGAEDWRGRGGLAEILYSLPWRGTTERNGTQLHETTLKHGFSFQADLQKDYTAIVATGLADDGEVMAGMVSEILMKPLLDQNSFQDLKRQQLSRIEQFKQLASMQGRDVARSFLYAGHPYGWPVKGDADALKACTVWEAYETAYRTLRPDRCLVVCVGDRPVAELKALVEKAMAGWVPPPTMADPDPHHVSRAVPQDGGSYDVPIAGVTTVEVVRVYPAAPMGHTDYPGLELLRWILHFRIKRDVQETRGLCSNTNVGYTPWRNGGMLEVGVTTTRDKIDEVRKALDEHVAKLRDGLIPAAEIAKRREYIFALDTRNSQNGWAIALRLGRDVRLGAGPAYQERYFYALSKASPNVLKTLAGKYLGDKKRTEVLCGDVAGR
ncbi:MAG: M16 family metallopeptidase [Planctomycetota bacterium]|jgi:zinc protease